MDACAPRHFHGHRRRLRERFNRSGDKALDPHELLELILTYSIARKDTKPLAKALINRFGSFAGVLDAPRDELSAVEGIGPRSAQLLSLFKPAGKAYLEPHVRSKEALHNPAMVADYCRLHLGGKSYEAVHVLYADVKNRVIAERTLSEGTIDESPLYPRRLIEEALTCRATGFILVHNHPSGQVQPSPADKALTKRVHEAAQAVDLRFLDHLIVGQEGYFSFRQAGLLN